MKTEQRRALEILAHRPQTLTELARALAPNLRHARELCHELVRNGHAETLTGGLSDADFTLHITPKGLRVIQRQPKQPKEKNS